MDAVIIVDDIELVREGTLLVTRRNPADDIFMDKILKFAHLGIVAIEDGEKVVYDLHPDNKNDKMGNLDRRKFKDYMVGKKLIGTHHTGTSTARIQAVSQKCWKYKYKTWHFDCQRFVDDVTHKEFRSDLYSYYAIIILTLAVAGVVIIGGSLYLLSSGNAKIKTK